MAQNYSLQAVADMVVATSMVSPLLQPTVSSVLSSAVRDLALAVIKCADITVSSHSMKRLAEQIRENEKAKVEAYIKRCAQRQLQISAAPAA